MAPTLRRELVTMGAQVAVFVVAVLALQYQLGSHAATITCTRDARGGGDCEITRVAGFQRSSDRVAIADIQAVELGTTMVGKKGTSLAVRIELVTAARRVPLTEAFRGGAELPWRQALVPRLQAFLAASGPGTFADRDVPPSFDADLRYEMAFPLAFFGLGFLLNAAYMIWKGRKAA